MVQYLQVGLVLDEFLRATVKQADVGVAFLDRLSTELQHKTQHSVSSRVLGTEVDGQVGHIFLCGSIFVCQEENKTMREKIVQMNSSRVQHSHTIIKG